MNWFGILKNQISVPGLSMRQMDLDNIIEEEDDECLQRLIQFCYNLNRHEEHLHGIWDYKEFLIDWEGPDKEICDFLDELKDIENVIARGTIKENWSGSYNTLIRRHNTLEAGCYQSLRKNGEIMGHTIYIYPKKDSIHGMFLEFAVPPYDKSDNDKIRDFVKFVKDVVV